MKKYIILTYLLILISNINAYCIINEETGASLLYKYGFVTGANGDLMVDKQLTRAEVAVILSELNGTKNQASTFQLPSGFSDVGTDKWYSPYIAYGRAFGLLGGYPNGSFMPDKYVTEQEFAAFMMNAMGYNGDYNYDDVVKFAALKNVYIIKSKDVFTRGDAFEGLWDVVNQPRKGENQTIGVTLGKLENTGEGNAYEIKHNVYASSQNKFTVEFLERIQNISMIEFEVSNVSFKNPIPIQTNVSWDNQNTKANLKTNFHLDPGNYEIKISDFRSSKVPIITNYIVTVERERVDKVVYQSNEINRYSGYIGTIAYIAYNQYNEDITDSPLGRKIMFISTTSVPFSKVDYESGLIIVEHGNFIDSTNNLLSLPNITITATESSSGYSNSHVFKVSDSNSGLLNVKINGIVDEYGNYVEFKYDISKNYYLDIEVSDISGRITKNYRLLSSTSGGSDIVQVSSTVPSIIGISKVADSGNNNHIRYKLSFISMPYSDLSIAFQVVMPFSSGSEGSAFYTTILKK